MMRAQAATGDVRGVRLLAERLERVLAERRAERESKGRRGKKATSEDLLSANDVAAAASVGGAIPGRPLGFSGGPAVEAEVVMCEAEAKAAAGDADGARAALERLKKLDYSASSKVLRDRSTELLVSLFVKEIVSRGDVVPAGGIPAMGSLSAAAEGGDQGAEQCVLEEIAPEVGEDAGLVGSGEAMHLRHGQSGLRRVMGAQCKSIAGTESEPVGGLGTGEPRLPIGMTAVSQT